MEEKEGDYIPPEREEQVAQFADHEEEMSKEEKKLAASVLPKKRRQLYEHIVRAQRKKASEVRT